MRAVTKLTVGLAMVSLAACVSVLPSPDRPDALYRIGPLEASRTLDDVVAIRQPDAPRLFGGRAIAAEDEGGALRLVPGVEWFERATRMLQLALLDVFGANGAGAAVAAGEAGRGSYELMWRLSDFTLSGGTARCRMELTLLSADGEPLAQLDVYETAPAQSSNNEDRALALAQAGRACVSRAADFLVEQTSNTRPAES